MKRNQREVSDTVYSRVFQEFLNWLEHNSFLHPDSQKKVKECQLLIQEYLESETLGGTPLRNIEHPETQVTDYHYPGDNCSFCNRPAERLICQSCYLKVNELGTKLNRMKSKLAEWKELIKKQPTIEPTKKPYY